MVGAGLFAASTSDAGIGRLEGTGRDEETVEEGTYDVALGPFQRTGDGVGDACLVGTERGDDAFDTIPCQLEFALLFLRPIDIEPGQTDVGFGHLHGPG